ncbi:MAG: hypothetical protein H7A32_01185 [Deltaproteobacteria bacterium]|nr:hypothetical protein [Deltaproteobacteria bacterium]
MNRSELLNLKKRVEKELVSLIKDLGKDGGFLSPSIYDTCQYLRFMPPQDPMPTVEWLLEQQQADGGWGNINMPLSRDVPTVAAILALDPYQNHFARIKKAQQEGLNFIKTQKKFWQQIDEDELMVGVEIILPKLLHEAKGKNILLDDEHYEILMMSREKKLKLVEQLGPCPGTPIAFSWEAFDFLPDPLWFDASGSVGSSPAATIAWLKKAELIPELKEYVEQARSFLQQAEKSTHYLSPRLLPFAWPVHHFEIIFSLFPMIQAGLDKIDLLFPLIQNKSKLLFSEISKNGFGHNPFFISGDVDDTAEGLEILSHLGFPVDKNILKVFIKDEKIFTYPGELHASSSATAHAIHAMPNLEINPTPFYDFLYSFQREDGCWKDKWHISEFYSTSHALIALKKESSIAFDKGFNFLINSQNENGSWGSSSQSTYIETSYVILSLLELKTALPDLAKELNPALEKGFDFMLNNFHSKKSDTYPKQWVGKELFSIYRVDRSFELSCILRIILDKLTKMEEGKNE